MCGRFTVWAKARGEWRDVLLAAGYDIDDSPLWKKRFPPQPRYNIAPTQTAVVYYDSEPHAALWGITTSFSPRPLINARSDKLDGAFWRRYWTQRCLVPADGYYEWDQARQPWFFSHNELPLFCFAGLQAAGRFALVTAPANADAAPVHARMPVILDPQGAAAWLKPDSDPVALALPPPLGVLSRYRVSGAVGNVRSDGPELIRPCGGLFG